MYAQLHHWTRKERRLSKINAVDVFHHLAGRGDWIRTNDNSLPKRVHYQAVLHPEGVFRFFFYRLSLAG